MVVNAGGWWPACSGRHHRRGQVVMVAIDVCGGGLHCNGERRECCNASSKPDCVAIIVRDK